jgi:hypothetical protein
LRKKHKEKLVNKVVQRGMWCTREIGRMTSLTATGFTFSGAARYTEESTTTETKKVKESSWTQMAVSTVEAGKQAKSTEKEFGLELRKLNWSMELGKREI